jgi:hypothetical protein
MAQALFAITKIYRMEKYSGERDDCNRALVIFFGSFSCLFHMFHPKTCLMIKINYLFQGGWM